MIVHAYKKALIKRFKKLLFYRCAKPFSIFSTEKAAHVCNTAIVKKTISDLDDPENGNNEATENNETV